MEESSAQAYIYVLKVTLQNSISGTSSIECQYEEMKTDINIISFLKNQFLINNSSNYKKRITISKS